MNIPLIIETVRHAAVESGLILPSASINFRFAGRTGFGFHLMAVWACPVIGVEKSKCVQCNLPVTDALLMADDAEIADYVARTFVKGARAIIPNPPDHPYRKEACASAHRPTLN